MLQRGMPPVCVACPFRAEFGGRILLSPSSHRNAVTPQPTKTSYLKYQGELFGNFPFFSFQMGEYGGKVWILSEKGCYVETF
jgi:hypothetical protein